MRGFHLTNLGTLRETVKKFYKYILKRLKILNFANYFLKIIYVVIDVCNNISKKENFKNFKKE